MKKLVLFFAIALAMGVAASAQGIYTKVQKYDKFDDVVWIKNVKTLITQTDSTFVIETKGGKAETYRYSDSPFFAIHVGSRDSLANLVADVWGYETHYYLIDDELRKKVVDEIMEELKNTEGSLSDEEYQLVVFMKLYDHIEELPVLTIRTVSELRYFFSYETDLAWIKYPDGSRIIYTK